MDFLRSRRFRLAVAWLPFAGCVFVVLAYAAINSYGRWKLDRTVEALVARGFPRTEAEAIGPLPADHENLLKHPVMLAELQAQTEHPTDPFGEAPTSKHLTWIGEMNGLGAKVQELTHGKTWLDPAYLRGPTGRAAALELMQLFSPFEERRQAAIKAIAEARPACASYEIHDGNDEMLHALLDVSRFFIDRGQIALAAGRKRDAREDFKVALLNTRGMQTTAVSQWHADAAISQMQDLVRTAFMEVPPGLWTEDELRDFDHDLQQLGDGRLMMKFQRLHVTWLIELRAKLEDGRIAAPKRIDWEEWKATWEWTLESLAEHTKMVWLGVRPKGLDDLEFASAVDGLAGEIDAMGEPPDWQRLLEFLPSPEEFFSDDADNRLQRFHCIAETVAWSTSIGPYTPRDFTQEIYNDDRAYSEGSSAEGHVWIAMARWAIALERHWLRHGTHPASLDGIDADLGSGLPADPLSRKPFRYRSREDGGFELEAEVPSWKPEGPLVWRREMGP